MASGFNAFGDAIGDALKHRDAEREKMKREAQLANALRRTLDIVDPEGKDMRATVGLPQLQGELQARTLKAAELDMALKKAQLDQVQAGQRFAGELAQFGPAEEQPMVLNPEELQRRASPGVRGIAGAASRAGYSLGPDELVRMATAMDRMGRRSFTPGTVLPVEGMDGYVYGVQNAEGSGSFLPKPRAGAAGGPVGWKDAPEVPGYAKVPGAKGEPKYVKLDSAALADQGIAVAELEKTLAQLESMKRRGVKTAKVSRSGGAVEGGAFTWGDENIEDVIAGVQAELQALRKGPGGATPAAGAGAAAKSDAKKPEGMSDAQILAEARTAIAAGKDPDGVKAKLKAWGLELQ
jgi:hypothetical protein